MGRSQFVEANGLTLHTVDYGGDGPPLLAVHGTGMVAQVWGVMAPYLTPHFRVVALDRRGHGDSDKPESGYEVDDAIPDVLAVIEHFEMSQPVALGHSSGATALGVTAGRNPGLFARIAMVDPIIFPRRIEDATMPHGGAASMLERTRRRRSTWPSAQAMFDSLAAKPPFDSWQPAALWSYVRHATFEQVDGSVTLKCPPELEAEMYRHAGGLDIFAEFAAITAPLLIVRGGATDRFPRENGERAVVMMASAQMVELQGLTHFASMEDPELVASHVVPFFGGVDSPMGAPHPTTGAPLSSDQRDR